MRTFISSKKTIKFEEKIERKSPDQGRRFFVCGRRVFVPTAIGRIGEFGYPTSGEA